MDKRSPLKDKPLRNPGQSLEQQINDLIVDKFLFSLLLVLVFCIMAGLEWWNYYHPITKRPFFATFVLIIVVLYALWTFIRFRSKFAQLLLGLRGEKIVGQNLERLRQQHYEVFHDVIGDGFNIDHVIIGPAGIFTVETKTYSRPHADEKIIFDGKNILKNGIVLDQNPVIQARAQASWLRQLLEDSTGHKYDVKPVVVFPGWFIEQRPGATHKMWVLEPKALPSFLSHEPEILQKEDIKLASFHLAQFIRSQKG